MYAEPLLVEVISGKLRPPPPTKEDRLFISKI